jgi:ATP-dependent DNA helicase PIF1
VSVFLFWDEVPMMNKLAIECVDKFLKDLMANEELIGGKLVIFGGDFRQLLPVIPKGNRSQCVSSSLKFSYIWRNVEYYQLTKNMRVGPEEIDYANYLLRKN